MFTPAMRATCASPHNEKWVRVPLLDGAGIIWIDVPASMPTCELTGSYLGQDSERCRERGLVIGVVAERTGLIVDISMHVEMSMAAQSNEDRARDALRLAAQRLLDHAAHGMVGFGSREDALGAGKLQPRCKAVGLCKGAGFDEPQLLQQAHQRRHAVIPQAARMKARRHEGRA